MLTLSRSFFGAGIFNLKVMKYIKFYLALVVLVFSTNGYWGQTRTLLLEDDISIRAIEVVGNSVYYAGSQSKMGRVDISNPKRTRQVRLSSENLEFRTIGYHKKHFYTISIGSPARFYRIKLGSLSNRLIQTDSLDTAFYDAIHFTEEGEGWTFSDPNKTCTKIAKFQPKENRWAMLPCDVLPKMKEGEAAFAASNSNFSSVGNDLWLVTGGSVSRVFHWDSKEWRVYNTPAVQGKSSIGLYSVDFYSNERGIAVGGDYTDQMANKDNIIITDDGGKTWKTVASGKNAGYMTFVQYRPGSNGKQIIVLGDQHLSFSKDGGKSWEKISDEKGFFVGQWIDENRFVAAGKGKIVLWDWTNQKKNKN